MKSPFREIIKDLDKLINSGKLVLEDLNRHSCWYSCIKTEGQILGVSEALEIVKRHAAKHSNSKKKK